MDDVPVRKRAVVEDASQPKLKRFMKLRRDETRDQWVLLAPEKILTPDDISVAILQLCDGERTVGDISAKLAEQYNAPEDVIRTDVIEMLQGLADKGYLTA